MDASASRLGTRVLVLTDEVQLFRLARSILAPRGCVVEAAPADACGVRAGFDVVILDLPRLDPAAIERRRSDFPAAEFLALCGACSEADGVAVIDGGADWLARPFRPDDLAAKVRAAELRRLGAAGAPRRYAHRNLTIDFIERSVLRDGRRVALTPNEGRVMAALARAAGRVATLPELVACLGRDDSLRARQVVHALIWSLRRKVERDPANPQLVLNEPRIGYRLAPDARAPGGDVAEPMVRKRGGAAASRRDGS